MRCSNRDARSRSPRQPLADQWRLPLPPIFRNRASVLLCMLAASACAAPDPLQPAKEAQPVIAETTSISSTLNAEQILRQLLNVIRDSENAREITSESLGAKLGVEFVTQEPGYHVFGEELTPEWAYGMELYDHVTPVRSHRFLFSFNSDPGAAPSMADICRPDFKQFTAELEAMGFTRTGHYDSPPQPPPGAPQLPNGSWMYDHFDRPGMHIEVYPQPVKSSPPEQAGHECIRMILIS